MTKIQKIFIALLLAAFASANVPTAGAAEVWGPLGPGLDGEVSRMIVWNGELIVSGGFSTAGGNPANRIAAWDGEQWSAMGDGIDLLGRMTIHNGHLLVFGRPPGSSDGGLPTLKLYRGMEPCGTP